MIQFNHYHRQHQEIFYYVNNGNKIRADDVTTEGTAVKITEKGNKEVAEALIAADGLLGAGLQPEASAATEAGKKALVEALNETQATGPETQVKKKRRKGGDEETTTKAEPKTLEES